MDSSIYQMHIVCANLFSVLISALQKATLKDATLVSREEAIEDAMDKYNMWAGNLGAGYIGPEYQKSLDYRLREASFYKIQVLSLMKDLRIVLENALLSTRSILSVDDESLVSDLEVSGPIETEEEDSPWDVSSDSEDDNSSTQQRALPKDTSLEPNTTIKIRAQAKLQQQPSVYESVGHLVQCLWRLPLRRPAPLDRMRERNTANTSYYQPFDSMYVRDKFPNIDESVALRFGKMISRRRQLIRYRKSHTEALQIKLAEKIAFTARRIRGNDKGDDSIDNVSELTPSFEAPSLGTQDTKATTLNPIDPVMNANQIRGLYAPSFSDSRSSVSSEQAAKDTPIRIPRRPTGDDGKSLEQFICPYCSTAQLIRSDHRWKKHILADLQPYVCTFPDCQLHEYVFKSRDDWFQHELQHHRCEWFCNEEPHDSFHELSDFLQHMETAHQSSLDENQVQTLWMSFQHPSRTQSGDCSLCGKHSARLKSHLARHLEQLSLFAIPQTDYMVDEDGNDAHSDVACRYQDSLTDSAPSSQDLDDLIEALSLDIVAGNDESLHNIPIGSSSTNEDAVPDSPEHFEDDVDTSWDVVTSKFQEAREAMHATQPQISSHSRTEPTIQARAPPTSTNDGIRKDMWSHLKDRQLFSGTIRSPSKPVGWGGRRSAEFWFCCHCGSENNAYTLDILCRNCHSHWRCGGCRED